MKHFFIALCVLASASVAGASGKLSLQNNFYKDGTYRPMIGLAIYQKLIRDTAFNGWAGYGNQYLEDHDDVNWFVAKAQLDVYMKRFTVAPGVQVKHLPGENYSESMPYVKVELNIW